MAETVTSPLAPASSSTPSHGILSKFRLDGFVFSSILRFTSWRLIINCTYCSKICAVTGGTNPKLHVITLLGFRSRTSDVLYILVLCYDLYHTFHPRVAHPNRHIPQALVGSALRCSVHTVRQAPQASLSLTFYKVSALASECSQSLLRVIDVTSHTFLPAPVDRAWGRGDQRNSCGLQHTCLFLSSGRP